MNSCARRGCLGCGRHDQRVVADHRLTRLGSPVAQHVGAGARGEVELSPDDVARPCLGDGEVPGGELRVDPVDRQARLVLVDRLEDRDLGLVDQGGVAGVHVEAAVAQDRDRDRVAVGVVEADRARVLRVPEGLPALRGGVFVAHAVASVRHSPRVDRVGHAVVPREVVVGAGVGVRGPDTREHVRDQLLLQREQQVLLHEATQVADGRHEDVWRDLSVRDLLEPLLHVVVGGDLHLDAVLLLELGDHLLVDVVGPVVEHERTRLDRRVGGDRVHRHR